MDGTLSQQLTGEPLTGYEVEALIQRLPKIGLFVVETHEIDIPSSRIVLKVAWRGGVPSMDPTDVPFLDGKSPVVHPQTSETFILPVDPGILLDGIRAGLRRLAEHEIDEWIRLDGRPVWDPHPVRVLPVQIDDNNALRLALREFQRMDR